MKDNITAVEYQMPEISRSDKKKKHVIQVRNGSQYAPSSCTIEVKSKGRTICKFNSVASYRVGGYYEGRKILAVKFKLVHERGKKLMEEDTLFFCWLYMLSEEATEVKVVLPEYSVSDLRNAEGN